MRVLTLLAMGGLSSALSQSPLQTFWSVPEASPLYPSIEPPDKLVKGVCLPAYSRQFCLSIISVSLRKLKQREKKTRNLLTRLLLLVYFSFLYFAFTLRFLRVTFTLFLYLYIMSSLPECL